MRTPTKRFESELLTAETIRSLAEKKGITLTILEAHECWAEHSDDYAASWLVFDANDSAGEIAQALTKWQARHRPQPVSTT